jgi:hypothetical protein
MAVALDHFENAGCESACLWVMRDNTWATRFYETAGWILDDSILQVSPPGAPLRPPIFGNMCGPGSVCHPPICAVMRGIWDCSYGRVVPAAKRWSTHG